tara:strand:+ start:6297 stop:7172 length:876 start_codon:yes stop_codon:yes gene_type:complete
MSLHTSFFSLFIKVLDLIPYSILLKIGKLLANIFYLIPNKHKKISLINLKQVFPDLKEKELKRLLKKSLFHSLMNILESGLVWGKKIYMKKIDFIEVKNLEVLEYSLNSNRGILLFTPHLGNIEILINFLGSKFNCTIPFTPPKNKLLENIVTSSRNSAGVNMVNADSKGIREILLKLRNKEVVAIASDQVPKMGHGIYSKFFDNEIYSMSLLPKLKKNTDCLIHLMYCERKKNGEGFTIYFDNPIDLSTEIQQGVDIMNNQFEKCIMKAPEQYSWEYKKFKRTNLKSIYD